MSYVLPGLRSFLLTAEGGGRGTMRGLASRQSTRKTRRLTASGELSFDDPHGREEFSETTSGGRLIGDSTRVMIE